MTKVTILFSTLNGGHTLPRMLDQLERLEPPAGGWDVVAIDNGSSDDTPRILRERQGRLPMTVVCEPRRGKNIALNTGLSYVRGEIIALTDDDIILSSDWLVSIEKIAAQQADYDLFGGPIYPAWEVPPPDWVLRNVPKHFLAWTNFPEGPIAANLVWGGNMAVRAEVFREERFAEDWDVHTETEFTVRAARRGHQCWHFHASPAGHIIRPYQYEPEWTLQRSYTQGHGDGRAFRNTHKYARSQRRLSPLSYEFAFARQAYLATKAIYKYARSTLSADVDHKFMAAAELRYWQGFWSLDKPSPTAAAPARAVENPRTHETHGAL